MIMNRGAKNDKLNVWRNHQKRKQKRKNEQKDGNVDGFMMMMECCNAGMLVINWLVD